MKGEHILVVGSVNADVIIEIDRLPNIGETLSASNPDTGTFCPGGKGANQAAAVARLAKKSTAKFICQFGNDTHAKALKEILEKEKVDISLANHRKDVPSGQAFIFLFPNGDNSIIIVGGANASWPQELSSEVKHAIENASMVLLQSEIPASMNEKVATYADECKIPVIWDTGGEDRSIPDEILPKITFLCLNETELSRLASMEVDSKEDAVQAARKLQRKGARNVIVTLGTSGSIFLSSDEKEELIHQPCFHVDKVVDTTGAGDCYRSAFAVALSEGKSIAEAMKFATAASALTIQTKGALPSLPRHDEVVAFLEKNTK